MKIAIGTTNRAKVGAVREALQPLYPQAEFIEISVPSGVADQPFSDEETRQGAMNRAQTALEKTGAHIAFGLEGGVRELDEELYCCNWGAVATRTRTYTSSGAQFLLPKEVAQPVRNGQELGPVMDAYTKTRDTRHGSGAVGVFTNGLVDRKEMFVHIVQLLIGQVQYYEGK